MLKKILAVLVSLYAAASFAAVDINKASAADLDGIKGIGPGTSAKIIEARKKGDFKSWDDVMERVSGIKEKKAAKLSAAGLTVGGAEYKAGDKPAPAKVAKAEPAKKDEMKKDVAKAEPAKKEEPKKP